MMTMIMFYLRIMFYLMIMFYLRVPARARPKSPLPSIVTASPSSLLWMITIFYDDDHDNDQDEDDDDDDDEGDCQKCLPLDCLVIGRQF